MKLCVLAACVFFAAGNPVRHHGGVPTTVHRANEAEKATHPHHGFADANLADDPSVKFMRGTASQQSGRSSHEVLPPAEKSSLHEVREEVDQLLKKALTLDSAEVISSFERELAEIQTALAKRGGAEQLLNEVSSVRAGLCSDGRFKRGECQEFMSGVCGMSSAPVPKKYCESFFYSKATKSSADVAAEDQNVLKQAYEVASESEAAAPAPAAAGGPGPSPGPSRFHMSASAPVAEQGFMGENVAHKDKDTMIGDWQLEFGPKAGHRNFKDICKDHANNVWCKQHGYYAKKKMQVAKGAAGRTRAAAAALAAVAVAAMWGV